MYRVVLARTAQRDLDKISGATLSRIEKNILALESNPRPHGVKKLKDILHRIRAGDWRILYAIQDREKLVTILRVLRRNESTYKNL